MQPTKITYDDAEAKLIGSLYALEKAPTVIIYPAFEGPSAFCHDYALTLHTEGFQVFIADMYGQEQVGTSLEKCIQLITPFLDSRAALRQRALAAYQAVCQWENPEKIGALGFCFGGMCMLELARSGAHFKAGVSVHGLLEASQLPTHPIQASLLILHGFLDPQVPPSAVLNFTHEMNHHDWQIIMFGSASHAFSDPKTGSLNKIQEKSMGREYHAESAKRSLTYLLNFFNEKLK